MATRIDYGAMATRAVLICAGSLLFSGFASAQFLNPLSTLVGIDANAVNSGVQPGVARTTNGTGPIADSASELFGLNSASSAASVDAIGVHASTSIHADASNPGYSAAGRAFAGIVNPFMLVPRAGFTGNQATLNVPYSFGGSLNLFPSLMACATCFGLVQASLGVDGMVDQFSFLGASSQGTQTNPTFFIGGVARSGVLEGLVPVNTELYLRASLLTQGHCQSDLALSCGVEALFGGTLSYLGFSPDAVDIVWGLAPTPLVTAVPEPENWALLVAGLLATTHIARRRRS